MPQGAATLEPKAEAAGVREHRSSPKPTPRWGSQGCPCPREGRACAVGGALRKAGQGLEGFRNCSVFFSNLVINSCQA